MQFYIADQSLIQNIVVSQQPQPTQYINYNMGVRAPDQKSFEFLIQQSCLILSEVEQLYQYVQAPIAIRSTTRKLTIQYQRLNYILKYKIRINS
ncbi:unnamed protein product [Paramecium octaurelia]|uniref:Uncharacterized protein n=1 Tax=Paramecium octaurelia TaxID=43137 RepID=A0A8S1T7Q5_PAROT|nr:unnamed protein product [Paramecium octaurelia]CAD8146672.1 unnamed protein product [Paramecium octaurelia]